MKKLFLNNAVIKDLNLDNYDIAVYVALRSLYDIQMNIQVITFNMIAYTLFGNRNYAKYTVNHLKYALGNLESAGLIKKVDAYSTTEFIIDMGNLHFEQYNEPMI